MAGCRQAYEIFRNIVREHTGRKADALLLAGGPGSVAGGPARGGAPAAAEAEEDEAVGTGGGAGEEAEAMPEGVEEEA
jgi:hypothetical protein